MNTPSSQVLALSIGVALGGMSAAAQANPFQLTDLAQGYMVAAAEKDAEGKCGEGKCGGDKKATEDEKTTEGKCGEGKCGGDMKSSEGDKAKEGKCGEGKCGGAK